ncbi:aryl-alcohol oxidase-like protein [Mycena alexandri]|uniref:Aryl-alcohol oxidase-like protein n=1 Tax=Mycena alexandri TaxID=1745969 RepID=A0AAD6XDE8_9AGAR|nr:aryl-alcohol oxidase-like protein [Mycena alexandri]
MDLTDLLASNLTFDFIIVGGGTAGNVLGNRLSENKEHSIVVIEAGGSNADVLNIIVPFYAPRATPHTAQDWNYTTIPQAGLNDRSLPYPRGFVLGGSSSVNSMAYTRGSKDDYDRFARVSGDDGWSWQNLVQYMRRNERFHPPPANSPERFDPAVHSLTGINSVSLPKFLRDSDARVVETTSILSQEFPFNIDMNSGSPLGIGWTQSTINNGSRSSSATSYLAPQYITRPNLHVVLNTMVTRVQQSNHSSRTGKPIFQTVEFAPSTGGPNRFSLTAKKELILSAGSIGTPHILMLSGIGDSSTLSSIGIKPTHILPSVGRNLIDHPFLRLSWLVNSTKTFDNAERNATLAAEEFDEWNSTKTGPLADSASSQLGWLRLPPNSSVLQNFSDPSAGPLSAHFELLFANGIVGTPPPTGNYFTISVAVVSPTSRGSVTLNSSDPFAAPMINPNFFESDRDLALMREAVRTAQRFVAAPNLADYILSPISINATASDAELDSFIRQNTGSEDHPVGTAAMSAVGADYGVVDPDLTVKGVLGLRIVDASIFPFIPAAHTQAACYTVAERAADLIKAAFN